MVFSQLINKLSLVFTTFSWEEISVSELLFHSQNKQNPLQDSASLWLTWKGQGDVCVRCWAGSRRQLQLWFAQLYPRGTYVHGFLTLSLHTFLSVIAFLQCCDLNRTLPYAQHYSPVNPVKVFYQDEKKIAWASATPIAGTQCQFENNYLGTNAYKQILKCFVKISSRSPTSQNYYNAFEPV